MSAGSASTKTKFVALFVIATLVAGSLAVALPLNSPENNDTEPELKMYSDAVGATELVKKNGAYIVSNGQVVYLQLTNLSDNSIMTSGTVQNGETEVLVHYSNNGANSDIIFTQVIVQNGDSEIFPWTVGDFTADGIFSPSDPNDEAVLCDTTGIVMYGKIRSTGLRDLLTAANYAPDFTGYCGAQDFSSDSTGSSSTTDSTHSNNSATSGGIYNHENVNSYCTSETINGNLKITDEETYVKFEECRINGNVKIKNSNIGFVDSSNRGNIKSSNSDLVIEGGQVRGNIDVNGGSLYVEGVEIRGNVEVEDGHLYLGGNTVIHGNLKCENVEYSIYDTVVKGKVKGCDLNGTSGSSDNIFSSLNLFDFCTITGEYKVCTDKNDYEPGATVPILGRGFEDNANLLIRVIRPDSTVVTGDGSFGAWPTSYDAVTTNEDGIFLYRYVLDGIQGEYLVQVLHDDEIIATHTFLDHGNGGDDDDDDNGNGDNGDCKCKGLTSLTVQYTGTSGVTIKVMQKGQTSHIFTNVQNGDPLTITPLPNESKLAGDTIFRIFVGNNLVKEIKIHTSCSIPIEVGFVYDDGDKEPDNSQNAPFLTITALSKILEGKNCPPPEEKGRIIIVKDAKPNDPTDFTFARSFGANFQLDDDSDGTLSNTITFSNISPGTYTVTELATAGFTLTDITCATQDQNDTTTEDLSSHTATIDLDANEIVICKFTNEKVIIPPQKGAITIVKDAVPDDSQDFSFTGSNGIGTFSLDDDDDQTLSNQKTFNDLLPGTYSVVETLVPGWTLTSATCSDGSSVNNIQLSGGEHVTCTFVNTKETPPPAVKADLSIIKSDSPDPVSAGSQLAYSITVKNNGPSTANNVVITDTLPSEVTFVSASTGCINVGNTVTCNIGTLAVNQSVTKQIVVSVSQSATGTIINTARVESSTPDPNLGNNTVTETTSIKGPQLIPLKVIKLLKQPNGILTELQNAQVIVQNKTGSQVASGNTGVDGSVTFNLPAGVYTVKIIPPAAADGCRFVPDIDTVEVILLSAKIVKVVNTIACPQPGAAKIIVQKFLDKDGDGIGDEVMPGVKIVLLNSFGNEVDRGVTDANGIIMFDPIATQNTQFSIIEPAQVLPGNCVVVSSNPALPITVIVSAGQTHPVVKISNVIECQKIPLNVIKWLDANKNGVQDEGESGLPNFTIQVFDQTGFNLIAQEVTDVNGDAMFNLVPGTYIVREKFPSAPDNCTWFQTFPGPDANLQHKITLSTADPTIKFGNFLKCPEPTGIGRIQVIKFQDDNRNKVQDNGEARLAGFEIKVFDSTGITLIASGLTDSNGHVQFDVPNGVYVVREVTREVPESCISGNWEQTTPGAPFFQHKVSVLIGSDQTVQFGNVLVCPDVGKIVVTKFNDKDGDGVRDMVPFVEPVVKGFRIKVYHPDDLTTPLMQTLTDSQGMATFILPPGNYIIREDVFGPIPSDCRGGQWTQTFPGAGTVVQPTNFQHMVTVGVQQVVTMSDIGQPLLFGNKLSCFEAPVKLVVHKFFDTNRDGVENNSESALKGFTIWVYTNQMQLVAKGTTDTTGSVTFNLPAGSYKVFEEFRVLMPSECLGGTWIQTSPGFDVQESPLVDIDELAFNSITITLLPGEMKHVKFGNVLDCPPQADP